MPKMKENQESQTPDALPFLPSDFVMNSFSQATAVTPSATKENLYLADLKRDWCIGIVPHGGYLMSLVVVAVQTHFQLKHPHPKQTDLITSHVEFLARSATGPVEISIHELKLGRQFSTVRAQLLQFPDGNHPAARPRICMEAHVTMGNLERESQSGGVSLPTRSILPVPSPPPRTAFHEWEQSPEWASRRPAAFKVQILLPPGTNDSFAHPVLGPSVREHWVRWQDGKGDGEGFQIASLAYLADAFRPLPEAYGLEGNWYPTLSYSMDIKKAPPPDGRGWRWLFMRIEMRVVRCGRFDVDVVILDEGGEVVALSRHAALIVSAARNHKAIGTKL